MFVVGLTGSIAMGKSATATLFRSLGAAVFDADLTVHQMYDVGGAAVPEIQKIFPDAVQGGKVDRGLLGRSVLGNGAALARLEKAIHPLVDQARTDFIHHARAMGRAYVVLDVPLLFETGLYRKCDCVVVVSASRHIQRQRALGRPTMTPEKLSHILERQVPDHRKRMHAHCIIHTGAGLPAAFSQVSCLHRQFSRLKPQLVTRWQPGGLKAWPQNGYDRFLLGL